MSRHVVYHITYNYKGIFYRIQALFSILLARVDLLKSETLVTNKKKPLFVLKSGNTQKVKICTLDTFLAMSSPGVEIFRIVCGLCFWAHKSFINSFF